VDFSGDLDLRDRVHQHFAGQLLYSCFAGSAQSTDEGRLTAIEGPQPVFFFAPIQIRKRNADWGPEGVSEHIGAGLLAFFKKVTGSEPPLMKVIESQGYEAAQVVISRLFHGQIAPVEGHVIRL
jgi:hypothetical protein